MKKPPTTKTAVETIRNEYSFTGRENSVRKWVKKFDAFDKNVMTRSKLKQSDVVNTVNDESLLANNHWALTEHNTTSLPWHVVTCEYKTTCGKSVVVYTIDRIRRLSKFSIVLGVNIIHLYDAYRKNVRAESMAFLERNPKTRSLKNFKKTTTSFWQPLNYFLLWAKFREHNIQY